MWGNQQVVWGVSWFVERFVRHSGVLFNFGAGDLERQSAALVRDALDLFIFELPNIQNCSHL